MKNCSNCSAENKENAKFCVSCGEPLTGKSKTKRFCSTCGEEVPIGSNFCISCGAEVSAGKGAIRPERNQAKARKKRVAQVDSKRTRKGVIAMLIAIPIMSLLFIQIMNKDYIDDQNEVRSLVDTTATWMLFFEQGGASVWSTGDVFTIEYANPLQAGLDVYRFNAIPTAVGFENVLPEKLALSQNYPNPFNPVTTIKYLLPFMSDVKLVIYNILGQEVFRLEQIAQQAGEHLVRWNGRNMKGSELSSGIYFYRLQAGDFIQTKKMVLLK